MCWKCMTVDDATKTSYHSQFGFIGYEEIWISISGYIKISYTFGLFELLGFRRQKKK